jgi:hypothetical protein
MKVGPETILCINFYEWIKNETNFGRSFFHIPNEAKRNFVNAQLMQKMGIVSGVLDYLCTKTTNTNKKGLWLEIKTQGKKSTKKQKEFMKIQEDDGFAFSCCDDIEEAKLIVRLLYPDYMKKAID